mmetsp:Transcript_154371/g.272578  ORF Transcript_154371/g.272578 Transcript_154371/m.272578 type:complete len:368 (+) Transcript_154371:3771-4874(+)
MLVALPDFNIPSSSCNLEWAPPSTFSSPSSSFAEFCECFSWCSSFMAAIASKAFWCLSSFSDLWLSKSAASFACDAFHSSAIAAFASSIAALTASVLPLASASSNFNAECASLKVHSSSVRRLSHMSSSFASTARRSSCSFSKAWSKLSTCSVTSAKILLISLRLPAPPCRSCCNSSCNLPCADSRTFCRPLSSASEFWACFSWCASFMESRSSFMALCFSTLLNLCSSMLSNSWLCDDSISPRIAACASSIAALMASWLPLCSASSNLSAACDSAKDVCNSVRKSAHISSSFCSTAIRNECSFSKAWSKLSTCSVTSANILLISLRLPAPPWRSVSNSSCNLPCADSRTVFKPLSSASEFWACFSW